MKVHVILGLSIAAACIAAPAMAATMQPPMDAFNDAFYSCDSHGAFQMSYDSAKPTQVTMTTSNDNAQHVLNRVSVATGVEFSSAGIDFWTDGKSVTVKGTKTPFLNCKMPSS